MIVTLEAATSNTQIALRWLFFGYLTEPHLGNNEMQCDKLPTWPDICKKQAAIPCSDPSDKRNEEFVSGLALKFQQLAKVRGSRDMATSADTEKQEDLIQQTQNQQHERPSTLSPSDVQYHPRTLKFWLIMFCNFLALFLVALDRTIIATAIPRITDEFHRLGDIGWYGSAYMLASASSQMLFGRIYKFYNMKWVFSSSIVLFEIGSAICGAAPSSNAFIAGRAIAGFASAGIFSGCMLILISMVPLHKRPMFQGLFGAVFGIASVMGPLVGGAFTSGVTWSRIIALFVLFGVLILVFAGIQIWRPETATIPAKTIGRRSILSASLFVFLSSSAMMIMIYYVPIWFQTVKLVNPVKSGIYTLPLVLSLVVASISGGLLTQKIGNYVPVMYLGPSFMSIGIGLMSTFNLSTGSSHWIGYQFLSGFGFGLGMQINGLVVQRILPPPDIPIGVALMFFLQQLGGSIFITVGQTIFSNTLVSHLSGIPGLDTGLIVNEGATKLVTVVPSKYIVMVQEAYNFACTRIFFAALGLAFLTLLSSMAMEWKSIKKGKNGQDSPTNSNHGHRKPHDSATGGPTQSPPDQTEEKASTRSLYRITRWLDRSKCFLNRTPNRTLLVSTAAYARASNKMVEKI
ncbi:major facilitator superfamily domain-containing protein [Penicillium malachiteum]|uniref:major facilitator superfamily domain-containing protein n=1 Tax=Penicillium malachiteum TaxID=1324776 RepID=UPI002547B3DD|nr:major facilitator superfamily domain-containing protein [Penicillium malachiteum]KAJ5730746.1 major facilitator superfamily domain-containing protein [Penicillium malachiteum]